MPLGDCTMKCPRCHAASMHRAQKARRRAQEAKRRAQEEDRRAQEETQRAQKEKAEREEVELKANQTRREALQITHSSTLRRLAELVDVVPLECRQAPLCPMNMRVLRAIQAALKTYMGVLDMASELFPYKRQVVLSDKKKNQQCTCIDREL